MLAYFDLKSIIDVEENVENNNTNTEETSSIEDVIYPMYLPVNTYLSNTEKVDKDNGERLILTFDGDSPFMLIEETLSYEEDHCDFDDCIFHNKFLVLVCWGRQRGGNCFK